MEERQNSAAKTISFIMLITLAGKVLGLYRDRLLAVHYSTGPAASAFFTASRIPRVFFDAVFASAIAACFIPVFSEYLEKKAGGRLCASPAPSSRSSPCSPAPSPWWEWHFHSL